MDGAREGGRMDNKVEGEGWAKTRGVGGIRDYSQEPRRVS